MPLFLVVRKVPPCYGDGHTSIGIYDAKNSDEVMEMMIKESCDFYTAKATIKHQITISGINEGMIEVCTEKDESNSEDW